MSIGEKIGWFWGAGVDLSRACPVAAGLIHGKRQLGCRSPRSELFLKTGWRVGRGGDWLGGRMMKIGLAQINAVVGDFPGNAKRILAAYRECLEMGADLVVTPEMSLVGYPPRDLVFKSQFVPKCLQALDYLADEAKEVPLLVGYVDFCEGPVGKPFRNAAAWLEKGQIRRKFFKTLLPTYDVFDERRYFEPGEACEPFEWRGKKLRRDGV